jgi:hypothetical protein
MTRLFSDSLSYQKRNLSKSILPQPSDLKRTFLYRTGGHNADTDFFESRSSFTTGQHVWVCKSKGRKQNRTNEQRHELFQRARILDLSIEGDDTRSRRVLVQYPKGSTYRVRQDHLIPILDVPTLNDVRLVIVHAETAPYRRACFIHGCVEPHESFCEIGCAEGATLHRLQKSNPVNRIVGIDKSEESTHIARMRLPTCDLFCYDILMQWPIELTEIQPAVVGIDINGNRELDAVLECLQVVMTHWTPRLIFVKSRALYHELNEDRIKRF